MPHRLRRSLLGERGIIVGAAVDLPNTGCIVGTIALPARADLLDGNALLRLDGNRRGFFVVWVGAATIQAPLFEWSRLSWG
jgi:hypothetical protein